MRRKLIQQLMVYGLGAAIFLTLGMRFQSDHFDNANAASIIPISQDQLSPINTAKIPLVGFSKQEERQAQTLTLQLQLESQQQLGVGQEVAMAVPKRSQEVQIASMKTQVHTYEVTAYYLNVRANAYKESKILNVVKQGTMLDVLTRTENGWLKIKDGGYVHGDYAKLVSDEEKIVEELTPLPDNNDNNDNNALEENESVPAVEPVSPTSIVKTESGLSEEDIKLIINGTELADNGLEEAILEVEREYGINALFTIAVMKLESGNGSSRLAKNKNNLFGLNASGKDAHKSAFSFDTKGDSVRKFGQLLSQNYVGKGYTTIEKVATKYCPANSKWSGLVKTIMKKDYQKLNVI